MPPTSEVDLQQLKQTVSILDLARERGLQPKRHGSGTWKVTCPLHDDKEASLVITPEKNLWHCFGCGKGGSNIDFLAEVDRLSVGDAIQELAKRSPGSMNPDAPAPEPMPKPDPRPPRTAATAQQSRGLLPESLRPGTRRPGLPP